MRLSFHKNLGLRFLVTSTPIVIVLAAILYQMFIFFTTNIIDELSERFANQQVFYDRSRTLQPLLQEIALSLKLARSQTIIDWASNEDDTDVAKRGLAELESARSIFRDGSYFFVIDKSGHYFFNDAKNSFSGRQLRYTLSPEEKDDAWYYATLKTPQECQLNINNDSELKVTKVWINCLVKNEDIPIGVIGTGIELTSFISLVLNSNQDGVINMFIDGDGAIQAHPDEAFIDFSTLTKGAEKKKTVYRQLSDEDSRNQLRTLLEKLKKDPDQIRTINLAIDGEDRLLGIAYLKEIDWFNITIISPKIWALGQSFLPLAILAIGGTLLTLVLVIILLHFFVLKRISRLDQATHQIANKQYQLDLEDAIPDEIGRLTTSFVEMAGAVHKDRQALEKTVDERTKALIEARDKAQSANLSKSHFLATMSHELRTPMTGVIGFADLLFEDKLPPESVDKVHGIKSSANALLRLLNDILDMSKLEAGKMEIENIDFNLIQLITDNMAYFEKSSNVDHQVDVSINLSEDFPSTIKSDPTRIRQILINLFGNALKFTHEGHIAIIGTLKSSDDGLQEIRIAVEDTGIGLDEDIIKELFMEFTQADASISRKYEGSGLGLSICKRLVELMGGHIGVESEKGIGSTFWFTVPYIKPTTDIAQKNTITKPAQYTAKRILNILLAEDNRVNQIIIRKFLGKYGHSVTIVENGIEVISAHKNSHFDLILMDIRMPEMNGSDATKAIRQMSGNKANIPIIALTADAMKEHIASYFEAGMNGCISKPINQTQMINTINEVLDEEIHVSV